VIATLNQYPQPNSNQLGYGYNSKHLRSSPAPNKLDTYVARFDYTDAERYAATLCAFGPPERSFTAQSGFRGSPIDVRTNNSKRRVRLFLDNQPYQG